MPDPGDTSAPRAGRLTAQALATAVECQRRLWLQNRRSSGTGAGGRAPNDHIAMLRGRAGEHEAAVVARFPDIAGPLWRRGATFGDAAAETLRLLRETRRPLHQPVFLSADGLRSTAPDIVYWEHDRLVVLDVRLAVRPDSRSDFALQMAHHRALIRETAGLEPVRFEVVNGRGATVAMTLPDDEGYARSLALAERAFLSPEEPSMLRGHSACRTCSFYRHCWDRAEAERRIEILPEVQAAHVPVYHALGVRTFEQLAALDPKRVPHRVPPVIAARAVVAATAWRDGRAAWLATPELPPYPLVWFDTEGDSHGEAAAVPIYLWGLALDDGTGEPRAESITAGFGPGADREAWERFVARASAILEEHPRVRWAHWDAAEPLWIRRYIARHGAPAGFGERMAGALFDLKPVLDHSLRLPLRSYSVKHVANWMGFAWRNPDAGSEWSTAQYQRARHAADGPARERHLAAIAEYNEDDLLALRTIWRWILDNGAAGGPLDGKAPRP